MAGTKVAVDLVGTTGARRYSIAGEVPEGARPAFRSPNGVGRLYVSDVPYEVPYNERPLCVRLKTNGQPCQGKQQPGHEVCNSHLSKG